MKTVDDVEDEDDEEEDEDAPAQKMSLNDFLNADPEEEKKQAKKKPAEPVKERILSEDEQKKREDNKRRLEEMRKKREMDAEIAVEWGALGAFVRRPLAAAPKRAAITPSAAAALMSY